MDFLGPKASCLFGLTFLGVGNYLIATTDSSKDDVEVAIAKFTIGFAIIAMGGMGPYITSFNIANLTNSETTTTSLIAALFNFSGLTYFIMISILNVVNVTVDEQREFICLLFTYICIGQVVLVYLI